MKPRDYVIAQIQHRQTGHVPYNFKCEKEVELKLDQYYSSNSWRTKITNYISTCLDVDTAQETDISNTCVRDVFGGIWNKSKSIPHIEQPALLNSSLRNYEFPKISQFIDPIYDNLENAINYIKLNESSFNIINVAWGVFETTWRMRGFENALMDSLSEPEFYTELLERITEIYIDIVKTCRDIPADAIMFGDDWGDQRGTILKPESWCRFIKPCWKKIYNEVHKQGKYVISHCCGSIADIMGDAIEIGLDVIQSVQPEARDMNPYSLKKNWGDKITFWGCIGSQSLIPFGKPDEIREEVFRLCSELGKGGGYIAAPAKGLLPETPVENAAALLEAFMEQESGAKIISQPYHRSGL